MTLSGCGRAADGVTRVPVSGKVTFSGEPVADGEIRLVAEDGKRTDAGRIKEGAYSLQAVPGKKRVEIYATKEDPSKKVPSAVTPGGFEPVREMYIPEKYNAKTALKADVTETGSNSFDYPLDAK